MDIWAPTQVASAMFRGPYSTGTQSVYLSFCEILGNEFMM